MGAVHSARAGGPRTLAISRLLHPLGHGPQSHQSVFSVRVIPKWALHVHLVGWPRRLQCAKFPAGPGPREDQLVLGQWALEKGRGGCRVPIKNKESSVGSRLLGSDQLQLPHW